MMIEQKSKSGCSNNEWDLSQLGYAQVERAQPRVQAALAETVAVGRLLAS